MRLPKSEARAALRRCRARGQCENFRCGRPGYHAAHIFSKGAGNVTHDFNLCYLCGVCHAHHHNGAEPRRNTLLVIAATREHCTPLDIEEAVYFLRRPFSGASAGQIEADLDLLTPGAQRLVRAVPEIARILAGGE